MGMRLEIQLASPPIGYVGVELGGGEVGVAEHLLDRAKVGSAFQQVRGERVPQQVGMDALGLEAGPGRERTQDQESPRARQGPAAGVEEELRPVTPVEVGTSAREVSAQRLGSLPADRDDPLLVALADRS